MPVNRLTEAFVAGLKSPEREIVHWDPDLTGFGLKLLPAAANRVATAGPGRKKAAVRKVFILQYRARGDSTSKRLTLGPYWPGNTGEARVQARELLARIALGADPALEKRNQKKGETVAEIFPQYLDHLGTRRKAKTVSDYRGAYRRRIEPKLGKLKVAAIARADVAHLHRALVETPVEANRTLAIVSAFFNWCIRHGVRGEPNPARGIEKYGEKRPGLRFTTEEKRRLWDALVAMAREGREPRGAIAAAAFLFFSGVRPAEAFALRWRMVTYTGEDSGKLHLTDTKTGESGRDIGVLAVALLKVLPRDGDDALVFSGDSGGAVGNIVKRLWSGNREPREKPEGKRRRRKAIVATSRERGLRARADLPEQARLYDLRHNFVSTGAILGLNASQLQSVAGHKSFATTEVYIHLAGDDSTRAAAARINKHMASEIGFSAGTDLTHFKTRGVNGHGDAHLP